MPDDVFKKSPKFGKIIFGTVKTIFDSQQINLKEQLIGTQKMTKIVEAKTNRFLESTQKDN